MPSRTWLATQIGARYSAQLADAGMTPEDSTGNLKEPLDDALRLLGVPEDELDGAGGAASYVGDAPLVPTPYLSMVAWTTLRQVQLRISDRFDVSGPRGGYRLSQAVKQLDTLIARAEEDIIRIYGYMPDGATGVAGVSPMLTMDYLNTGAAIRSRDWPWTTIGVGDG